MTESTLKTAIYNWMATILTTLYVGDVSARPVGSIAFMWHMLTVNRPATPILEGRLSVEERIGRDAPGAPDIHGSETFVGDREGMLYLRFFGNGARDALVALRNATQDPTVRPTMSANSFMISETQPIVDAHQYLDTASEDGAMLDMRIRYVDTWTTASGAPGTINTANQSYKVN